VDRSYEQQRLVDVQRVAGFEQQHIAQQLGPFVDFPREIERAVARVQPIDLAIAGGDDDALAIDQGAGADAAPLLDGLRDALASSVSSVFMLTFFILLISIAVVLLLKDRPLRDTVQTSERPPSPAEE